MIIKDTDLNEASFGETIIKNLEIDNCDLASTEFIKTKLNDIDFSTCHINKTIFDYYSIKGIIVDAFQCQDLIGMLGIKVK